jgi:GNAT superfamily N-acetyltransferase
MNEAALATAADENLSSTWALLGRSSGADVIEDGPLTCVATGLPTAFFNGAYLNAPTNDPQRLVAEAVRFFADRDLPWLLWVRDGVCSAFLDAGRSAGLRDAGGPPAMGLAPIGEAPQPPDGLRIEIATTIEALRDHASMLRDGFGLPQEIIDRVVQPALLDVADLTVLVGRVDDEPVSCSLLAISGATAGVYNVATPERFRGNGYGEALTWAAVIEGAQRGCSHAVLQASDAGYPIYRRMGFVDLGRYVQLEGPPLAAAIY